YNSVLYRLSAYDAATGYAWSEMSGTPISDRPGILSKANEYPVHDLKGVDGIVYFNEVFRSYGLASSSSEAYRYPLVRIFEVVYPENIAQLSAEVNSLYPAV
ncbi:MAG: hypothetical protein KAS52_06895, partial [Candidatus Heimdallarchaeota archaeon]|nr:hypothetical protein [Candidatus Heimdallarchaeota archaeon]